MATLFTRNLLYGCVLHLIQVDGYIARNFKGQLSHIGSVLDPLADKFLISILYVTLTVNGIIPGMAILDIEYSLLC